MKILNQNPVKRNGSISNGIKFYGNSLNEEIGAFTE